MAGRKDVDTGVSGAPAAKRRPRKSDERDVGSALRTAYQATVDEAVPEEMLDLLGKLR